MTPLRFFACVFAVYSAVGDVNDVILVVVIVVVVDTVDIYVVVDMILIGSSPTLSPAAGMSTCGGTEALPWEVQPKDGNYDGV